MKRIQARRGNGRFTRNTMENTVGLHCAVHERKLDGTWCGALNPWPVGGVPPTVCAQCGEPLPHEEEG
jgi:hypothetical protein